MNIALVVAFLFYIGSTFGWVLELFYRRFVSTKKWINPGFLTGPYLPIYGITLCLLFAISFVDMSWIKNPILQNIAVMIFMGVIITLLEYIAGIVFIKQMNVKLWDYSDRWGNIQGIICPLYTFFWCLLGGLYYFFIQFHIVNAVEWLSNNLAFSFVIGFFFGILTIDTVHSFNLVVKLKEFAEENEILVKFEELKTHIREEQLHKSEKTHFMFAFKTTEKLTDILLEYKEKYQSKFQNKKQEEIQMKNQKGVTLMLLVSTVIILALVVGTVTFNSMSGVQMQVYYNMYSDIELLDEKIAIYYLENNKLPIDENDTKNITDLISNYDSSNVNYNPNNSGTLYKIDLDRLQNLSLNYTNYYIDFQSHTIYFGDSIEIDDVEYYTIPTDYQEVNLNLYQ